jgi:cytochrome c oxidase cbb3-type subunit III
MDVQRVPLVAAVVLLFGGIALAQDERAREEELKNPYEGNVEVLASGRKLYMSACSGCHGPNADGGRGPRLAQNGQVRSATNRRLFTTIKEGVPGSDMPPTPLDDDKIWQLVSYVKSINAPAYETPTTGNAANGEKLFHGKAGCVHCHAVKGKGGFLGPDLSNAGIARSYAQLRESVLKPSERPTDGYQGVSVTFKDGRKIEGVAKNNTNYSIQVLDKTGTLHLINKLDLTEIAYRKGSLMPDDYAKRLTRQEIEDVLAYVSKQAVRVPDPEDKKAKKESSQ